ncbi:Hypothetical predicted protein [Octopus vulgaris]|uniref:Uncharacterized protein n=1 Tax=Octopus vulgaris TaxID=6645 RepID=A0AA36B1N7_OCTVU|nr:Hypothetical predicted protein [Octopus vulgaris]
MQIKLQVSSDNEAKMEMKPTKIERCLRAFNLSWFHLDFDLIVFSSGSTDEVAGNCGINGVETVDGVCCKNSAGIDNVIPLDRFVSVVGVGVAGVGVVGPFANFAVPVFIDANVVWFGTSFVAD